MGKRKPRHKTGLNTTLTKEIADAITKIIIGGGSVFTREQYENNQAIELPLKDGVFLLTPTSYRTWMSRRVVIPETKRTLHQQINEARFHAKMKKHLEDQKMLVAEAQIYFKGLQKLPIGSITKRRSSKKGYNDRDGDYHERSEEVIETPINPAMVAQKRQGAQFILERLDPAYKKGAESNVNVMINLGDLRRHKEKAEPKEVPKEDYTITE